MRILRILLPLLALLLWSATAKAQYNPDNPPEPGVYFTLTTRCVPSDAAYRMTSSGTRAFGSSISMSTSPNTGYKFLQWEDEEGTVVSTRADFSFTMPARNVTLIARFEYDPGSPGEPSTPEFKKYSYISFRMNPSDAGYMYSGSNGDYEVGTTRNFTVRANAEYKFINWTCEGQELGTSTTLEFTIPKGDRVLVANFEYDPGSPAEPSTPSFPRRLSLRTNLEGAGSLSGGGSHAVGANVTVSATTNTYYHFVNWTDEEGEVVSETARFTYTMPDRNVTLTANYTYNYDPSSPGEPGTPNPDGSVAENMVLWPRMGMYDDTHVQILCETPGATIHYTLDGSTPNAESPVYTEPVYVESNLIVKAIAYKEGMEDSPVVSYQVTAYKAGIPIFTFENLMLKISSATPGAIIRFTTDFTDPTEESEVYTAPFLPEENCRIKAYASKEGLTDSPINIFVFRQADYTIPAPTFRLGEDGKLVIIPSVEGGETLYTTDGTDPTAESPVYTEPLTVDGNVTVRAYTKHPNYYDSPIGEYVSEGHKVETPTWDYSNLALTLATATEGAQIRYTLDGTEPTEESALYSAPLRLTEDCKVTAQGFKPNYEPSDTISYTFVLADHTVTKPNLAYDAEALTVTMACDTEGAVIRYTTDGSVPTTATGTVYGEPIAVVGNAIYTAVAFRSDMFDSEAATLTVNDQKVPTPTSSFAGLKLTIACEDPLATIHYTLDGSVPTEESTLYEEPIALTEDCMVRFIALREGFEDSDVASFEFVRADYKVAKPELKYDAVTETVTISCATEGAVIRYTTDGSVPTAESGTLYTAPIAVEGNARYMAIAFCDGMFDSDVATLTIADQTVPTPTARYSAHSIYLECADPLAEIHYTEDGSQPTAASTLYYEAPINVSADRTIRFIAIREGFNDSEEASFTFTLADWKEAEPELTVDYRGRKVHLTHPDGLPLWLSIDGEERTIQTPDSIDVVPGMVNIKFQALATNEDRYDSGLHNFQIIFLQKPQLSYDGHALHYAPAEGDPNADRCEGWVYVNGELRRYGSATGELEMLEFCNVSVHLESDDAFRSDDAEETIDFYNTGRVAGARNGHRLSEAFGRWDDNAEDYTYLRVKGGEVSREDLEFIATLPNLMTLHLTPSFMTNEACDGVLADTRIETIFSNGYPAGILSGMPRLTTVMWGLTNSRMPEGRLTEAGNPNILLWITDKANAPADARNIVVYDYIGEGFPTDPNGTGIEGTAESISLQAGYPFHPHMPIHVEGNISLTKDFRQETVVGECQGWETLVLPFAASSITHAFNGKAVPFAGWDGDFDSAKPFWLFTSHSEGWNPAAEIEAYIPYIISMPNSADYMDQAILAGKVTFSASNVDLTPDGEPKATPWEEGTMLEGTFMPVEDASILSLNVGSTAGGLRPGSAFVPGGETRPFGAYVKGATRRAMPLFGGSNGVELPTVASDGLTVETPAPGMLRICSMRERTVAVCTMTGVTVRTLHLTAGESVTLEGLTRDLYLVGGRKVMVR